MNIFLTNVDDLLHSIGKKRPWLAQEAGIGLSTINNWFSNDRVPFVNYAYKVAIALEVSIDYLMTGKHPEYESQVTDPIKQELIVHIKNMDHEEALELKGVIKHLSLLTLKQPQRKSETFNPGLSELIDLLQDKDKEVLDIAIEGVKASIDAFNYHNPKDKSGIA